MAKSTNKAKRKLSRKPAPKERRAPRPARSQLKPKRDPALAPSPRKKKVAKSRKAASK